MMPSVAVVAVVVVVAAVVWIPPRGRTVWLTTTLARRRHSRNGMRVSRKVIIGNGK